MTHSPLLNVPTYIYWIFSYSDISIEKFLPEDYSLPMSLHILYPNTQNKNLHKFCYWIRLLFYSITQIKCRYFYSASLIFLSCLQVTNPKAKSISKRSLYPMQGNFELTLLNSLRNFWLTINSLFVDKFFLLQFFFIIACFFCSSESLDFCLLSASL